MSFALASMVHCLCSESFHICGCMLFEIPVFGWTSANRFSSLPSRHSFVSIKTLVINGRKLLRTGEQFPNDLISHAYVLLLITQIPFPLPLLNISFRCWARSPWNSKIYQIISGISLGLRDLFHMPTTEHRTRKKLADGIELNPFPLTIHEHQESFRNRTHQKNSVENFVLHTLAGKTADWDKGIPWAQEIMIVHS